MVQHLDDVNIQKQPIKQIVKTRGLFMANIISKVYEKVIQKRNPENQPKQANIGQEAKKEDLR